VKPLQARGPSRVEARIFLLTDFQAAKRKARGYTRFTTMRTVLFLIAGKLDFSAFNPHASRAPLPTAFSKEPSLSVSDQFRFRAVKPSASCQSVL
jgi:hypothetical protein